MRTRTRVAAVRTHRTLVGHHLIHVDAHVLDAIRPGQHLCPDDAAQRLVPRIRSAIIDVPRIDGGDHSILIQRHTRIEKGALVAVRARLHVLGARLRPLHRAAAGLPRRQSAHRHIRIVRDLDSKAATDVKTLHQDLIDAHAAGERNCAANDGNELFDQYSIRSDRESQTAIIALFSSGVLEKR